ncbi:hypothetical protein [Methanocella sp. MCL-LM]|uniref:hypothetical protein n=1 Tax=Methanocella sp. MCL-LM TaxID=3412035 RepID=UPI003C717985
MAEVKSEEKKVSRFSRWNNVLKMLAFFARNKKSFDALMKLEKMTVLLVRVNMELGKLSYKDPVYARRVEEFNFAMIQLTMAKYYAKRADSTGSGEDWNRSFQAFETSRETGLKLLEVLQSGSSEAIKYEKPALSSAGTEILFADEIPLVPEINPVVILRGSDYDMGYQYATQVIQIFGRWIFERKAGRKFTEEELGHIGEWEKQIRQYAPEILEMCRGWAAGATAAGVPMSYDDVLEIWTGHKPPETNYMGQGKDLMELPPLACSGSAAWGRATKDSRLVTGSSGDYDPTYSVTIVAYPDTGNSYVFSPFSAVGDVPLLGAVYMFGHPGMNSKGLAYVHHGGVPRMIEPKEHWGYGLRRSVSILHTLRFANNAREARDMELTYPVGDIGIDSGTAGGFYADSTYGYVLESRQDPVLIREAGVMGETDFLYANNSAIHPEAIKAGWMQYNRNDWEWDEHGGWRTKRFVPMNKWGSVEQKLPGIMSLVYNGSCNRNRYFYDTMSKGLGRMDFEYMKMMYRNGGTIPEGKWEEIAARYLKTGEWGQVSTGNAMNGLLCVMQPENGPTGRYAVCLGSAKRGLAPTSSRLGSFNPIYGETNAFWEITLAAGPAETARSGRDKAVEYLGRADTEFAKLGQEDAAYAPLKALLDMAREELQKGEQSMGTAGKALGNESLFEYSRALRAYTRSQVRSLQVYQALVPPPAKPEDLR